MTTITIDIADSKATDLFKYAKKIGGRVVEQKKDAKDDEEVTHGEYFGENIRRAINILKGR